MSQYIAFFETSFYENIQNGLFCFCGSIVEILEMAMMISNCVILYI